MGLGCSYALETGVPRGLVYHGVAAVAVDLDIVVDHWGGCPEPGIPPCTQSEGVFCLRGDGGDGEKAEEERGEGELHCCLRFGVYSRRGL